MNYAALLSPYHLCSDGIHRRIHHSTMGQPSQPWAQIGPGILNSGRSMTEILELANVLTPNYFVINARIREVYYYNNRLTSVHADVPFSDPIPSIQDNRNRQVLLEKAMLILRKISSLQLLSQDVGVQDRVLQIIRNLAI